MSIRVKRHLQSVYPDHAEVFARIPTVRKLRPRDVPLPEAVVRVVTGQMLSSHVAAVIFERLAQAARERTLAGPWLLDVETLRGCGLSGAKARTIADFGRAVGPDPQALRHWHGLDAATLTREIRAYKGMGEWTASIIALAYVGQEDVFPYGDGSLRRAIELLRERAGAGGFDPDLAAPYRSYLARYLWRGLDLGMLE
jgi:DNA-3-methyladenine glycosylase II